MSVDVVLCAPSAAAEELARLVARRLDVPRDDVSVARACGRCGSAEHGRPVVAAPRGSGLHVSVSRTEGLAVVAVTDLGPVGVDVESRAEHGGLDLRGWTRTEARVKADGRGLPVLDEDPAPTWADYRDVALDAGADHVAHLAVRTDVEPLVHAAHAGSGGSST